MRVRFSRRFDKQYHRASAKIKITFDSRLRIFLENPFNPILNNHQLVGKYLGYRSINITGDWRAIYSEIKSSQEKVIIFEILGTHSQLYK